jgi:hypothetical protein
MVTVLRVRGWLPNMFFGLRWLLVSVVKVFGFDIWLIRVVYLFAVVVRSRR